LIRKITLCTLPAGIVEGCGRYRLKFDIKRGFQMFGRGGGRLAGGR